MRHKDERQGTREGNLGELAQRKAVKYVWDHTLIDKIGDAVVLLAVMQEDAHELGPARSQLFEDGAFPLPLIGRCRSLVGTGNNDLRVTREAPGANEFQDAITAGKPARSDKLSWPHSTTHAWNSRISCSGSAAA